ncbi:hypothetical protein [Clostridium akagii]|uniref:hypothetical protein n=1 Tax=Clostridium akagii TaxID=91623 RepID=UPI00056971EF|nr:hypothetical protein [Clostridium akagii]
MSDKEKTGKTKALALALAVSVAMVNPLLLSGCTNPYTVVDEDQMKNKQDNNSTVLYGGGYYSPFIFTNISANRYLFNQNTTVNKNSGSSGAAGGGWKTWTSSSSGDYSGVHMSGFSS